MDQAAAQLLTVSGAFPCWRLFEIEDSELRRCIVDLVEQIKTHRR